MSWRHSFGILCRVQYSFALLLLLVIACDNKRVGSIGKEGQFVFEWSMEEVERVVNEWESGVPINCGRPARFSVMVSVDGSVTDVRGFEAAEEWISPDGKEVRSLGADVHCTNLSCSDSYNLSIDVFVRWPVDRKGSAENKAYVICMTRLRYAGRNAQTWNWKGWMDSHKPLDLSHYEIKVRIAPLTK